MSRPPVVVLDPRQQQLDAGAAGPRHSGRQIRAGRLVVNCHRPNRAGALAAYAASRFSVTTGMSIIATGAWYLLRGRQPAEARVMLHWGLALVAAIIPVQMFFGHVTGLYVLHYQPAKFAAIEARWTTQQPASEEGGAGLVGAQRLDARQRLATAHRPQRRLTACAFSRKQKAQVVAQPAVTSGCRWPLTSPSASLRSYSSSLSAARAARRPEEAG